MNLLKFQKNINEWREIGNKASKKAKVKKIKKKSIYK